MALRSLALAMGLLFAVGASLQVEGTIVGSQSATSRRLLQQGVGSSIVINGCTQGWTMSPTGWVQYHFSTPDGFVCQTDESMKWGCKLKGVVVFAIPVTILPISGLVCIPFGAPTKPPAPTVPITPAPTEIITAAPTAVPVTPAPTEIVTAAPTAIPITPAPTEAPAPVPPPPRVPITPAPTEIVTAAPTAVPITPAPTEIVTATPTAVPTEAPAPVPPPRAPTQSPELPPGLTLPPVSISGSTGVSVGGLNIGPETFAPVMPEVAPQEVVPIKKLCCELP